MPIASLMNVPITREVKKPRESLTTIGVFLICLTTSSARYTVSSEVFSPLMISTSGILSTGEKKCSPMNSSGRETPSASSVIGRVEVFEHSSASSARCGSISANTWALTFGSSNTASMTRSAPSASAGSTEGLIRASSASPFSWVTLPRSTPLATSFSE